MENVIIVFVLFHGFVVIIKLLDMLYGTLGYISVGSKVADIYFNYQETKGSAIAIKFLRRSKYSALSFYKKIVALFDNKIFSILFEVYYKWPILVCLTSAFLFFLPNGMLHLRLMFFWLLLGLIVVEILHEVIGYLFLGFLYHFRPYATLYIKKKEDFFYINQKSRRFFLTLMIQVICFFIAFLSLYYFLQPDLSFLDATVKDLIGKRDINNFILEMKVSYIVYFMISIFIAYSIRMYKVYSQELKDILK